jgi:hypothetical protein
MKPRLSGSKDSLAALEILSEERPQERKDAELAWWLAEELNDCS